MPSLELSLAIIIALLLLIILVVMVGMALSRLAENKELWERVRNRLASNDSHLSQYDAVVEWLLQKEGMRLDSSHFGCRWTVVPDKDGKLRDWLDRKEDRRREELAESIYKAYLQAMRDHDKEQKKEAKKK
jgi:hypothetical protein